MLLCPGQTYWLSTANLINLGDCSKKFCDGCRWPQQGKNEQSRKSMSSLSPSIVPKLIDLLQGNYIDYQYLLAFAQIAYHVTENLQITSISSSNVSNGLSRTPRKYCMGTWTIP